MFTIKGNETLSKSVEKPLVPFNNISLQWCEIADEAQRSMNAIFKSSSYCLGPEVDAFEQEICDYLGCTHAIAVNSGTSAIHLAVVAANIKDGDEVLMPAHTFIATCWGTIYANAKPVLCDVDPATGTIDLEDAERRVSPKCRAIIAVHLYGQPSNMDAVQRFAVKHKLVVIEDNAQAIGARWNGNMLGAIGHFGCLSFYPGKNLGAAGEGGLVTTSDAAAAARLRSLRNHAQSQRYVHAELGYNYRMDGLQAAVLRHKLRRLNQWTKVRRDLAERYLRGLADLPLTLPSVVNQDHVWHLFVVRTRQRDALREHLGREAVETGLHYPVPLHRQPALAYLNADRKSFPNSDRWANEGLSLPLFYGMTDRQIRHVIAAVTKFFECN
jgi:dTDP-4-amino-4,6-dideoxygalactose transaminase